MLITECRVGQHVYFGRGQGEKTLGEITKVNRVTVKVKQLESRGANRNYSVGTIWTVPPSLCTLTDGKAPEAGISVVRPRKPNTYRNPQSPKEILAEKGIRTGDTVEFDFRKRILRGRITRINQRSITIENVNDSRYPRGVYARHYNILRKVDASPAPPKAKAVFKVGDTGTTKGWYGNGRTEAVITKVNTDGTFEVYDGKGCGRRIQDSAFVKSPVSEAALLKLGESAVSGLSPENLYCDGEVSRTEARRRGASLHRVFPAISKAIGYRVTEASVEDGLYRRYRR